MNVSSRLGIEAACFPARPLFQIKSGTYTNAFDDLIKTVYICDRVFYWNQSISHDSEI